MSYSTNPQAVDRVQAHLDVLVTAQEDSVFFEASDPSKMAYRLREAFFAARMHPEFSRFHGLKEQWKVHVTTRGVECRRTGDERYKAPTTQVGSITLAEITRITGILGAALRFKVAEELIFPNADLSKQDKLKLFNWTATRDWAYIDHMDEGLTLTKHEVDFDLLWQPEDE